MATVSVKRETIRAFRETDLDGTVAAKEAIGWRERGVLVEFYGRRGDSTLFVADVNGEIAGCGGATVFPGPPATGWVHGIVVRPEHGRAGLGARLTETAIAWPLEVGNRRLRRRGRSVQA